MLTWSKHPYNSNLIAEHDAIRMRYLMGRFTGKGFEKYPVRACVFNDVTHGTEIYAGNSEQEAMTACQEHALFVTSKAA